MIIVLSIISLMLLDACQKELSEEYEYEAFVSVFEIDAANFELSSQEQSQEIKVKCNGYWYAFSGVSWLKFDNNPKKGDGVLTFTATNNTGGERTAPITIYSGFRQKTITVKQRSKENSDNTTQENTSAAAPSGDGTETNPYNVAGVLDYISGLGADNPSTQDIYVKGIITIVSEKFDISYGNATFIMSDTKSRSNNFTFYRGLYFGKTKYANNSNVNIKEGDDVVICGKVMNYKGNTPETIQGEAWVVSINGETGNPPESSDDNQSGSDDGNNREDLSAIVDGHECVDLGLPSGTCWATTNYGSDTPEGYGTYLVWSSYDIVTSNWGNNWKTPSLSDIRELLDYCTFVLSTINNHKGYTITGTNGNSIFLPASGVLMAGQSEPKKVGEMAYYWSSTREQNEMIYILMDAWYGCLNSSVTLLPIRPVSKRL